MILIRVTCRQTDASLTILSVNLYCGDIALHFLNINNQSKKRVIKANKTIMAR